MKLRFLLIISVGLTLTQCYYDQEGILYPETANCVPSDNPSFSVDILPILEAKCNNCHGGSFPSADIKLDFYEGVVASASNGSLMGSINQTGTYSPMPKNNARLSTCEITKIQNWITAGIPNN